MSENEKKAAEILKAQQTLLDSVADDLHRLAHNIEALKGGLGYVVALLVKKES